MALFTIQSANLIASSCLNIHNDICPICRCQITDKCLECTNKSNIEDIECNSVLGVCNHGYHLHCIQTWLQTKNVCPLDNQRWEYLKHKTNNKTSNN